MSLCTCHACDKTFSTPRGLDIHRNRSHVISDDVVLDFFHMSPVEQRLVIGQAFPEADMAGPTALATLMDTFNWVMRTPLHGEQHRRFKSAMTQVTGTDYRYIIEELP